MVVVSWQILSGFKRLRIDPSCGMRKWKTTIPKNCAGCIPDSSTWQKAVRYMVFF